MKAALLVLVLHGGGWVAGSPASVEPVASSFRSSGVEAESLAYPLGDYPAAARSLRDAITARRAHYRRVAIYGFSAGGTLAAYAAARGWSDASVVESSPIDLLTWRTPVRMNYVGTAQNFSDIKLGTAALRGRWSPSRRWTAHTPTLGLYGTQDAFVGLSEGATLDRQPATRLIVKAHGDHRPDERYRASIIKWLKSQR